MYTDCAFERDWENIILDKNQKAFAENMMTQYVCVLPLFTILRLVLEWISVLLVKRETRGNEKFADYHAFVGSPMWISVMTGPDIAIALQACAYRRLNPTA